MIDRRAILAVLGSLGFANSAFARTLAVLGEKAGSIDGQTLLDAEWMTGVNLDEEQRKSIVQAVHGNLAALQELRQVKLDEETPMATTFVPLAGIRKLSAVNGRGAEPAGGSVELPDADDSSRPSDEELAFLPVHRLAGLLRGGAISSTELTKLYLARLKRFDPVLKCVVHLTEAKALEQAARADRELAEGRDRGYLHGIPWGAKDLMAIEGYPNSWGIPDRRERIAQRTAGVAKKLEDAGAVLVGKLSLGALAMGDRWFGGMTRNPWSPEQGSSGSSAGSASAVVAGLVGFALGTETMGSIVSPSKRCGATSLRPTFGRVSRDGCMPLSWSFDKLGPMCRSIEDCARVFSVIHGGDGRDPAAQSHPFLWPSDIDLREVRVGVTEKALEDSEPAIGLLKEMGVQLKPVTLPRGFPIQAMTNIIDIEAAAMFDEPLRANQTKGWNRWPNIFRSAFFTSAVDYVRMQRVRMQLMRAFDDLMQEVDFLVNVNDLAYTNLTGHPSVVLPTKVESEGDAWAPRTVVITGQTYGDDQLLAFAHELERRVDGGSQRPPMERWLAE